jgi:hypothetical protein
MTTYSAMDLIAQLWDYHIKATGLCSRRFFLMQLLKKLYRGVSVLETKIRSMRDVVMAEWRSRAMDRMDR